MNSLAKSKSRLRSNLLLVFTICIIVFVLGWIIGPSGTVSGLEFSPDRFSHRSFRYYQQWCGIQITPTKTHEWHSKVDEYLHANGFVPDSDGPDPRWDFVKGRAPFVRGWHGSAKYMCQAIGCWGGSDEWVEWSEKHPDLAKIVWPQVVQWARNDQYDEVACLFNYGELEKAETTDDIQLRLEQAEVDAQK